MLGCRAGGCKYTFEKIYDIQVRYFSQNMVQIICKVLYWIKLKLFKYICFLYIYIILILLLLSNSSYSQL